MTLAEQIETALSHLRALRPTTPARSAEEMARRMADAKAIAALEGSLSFIRGEPETDDLFARMGD